MSLFLPEGRWTSSHLAIIMPPARAPIFSLGRLSEKSFHGLPISVLTALSGPTPHQTSQGGKLEFR